MIKSQMIGNTDSVDRNTGHIITAEIFVRKTFLRSVGAHIAYSRKAAGTTAATYLTKFSHTARKRGGGR